MATSPDSVGDPAFGVQGTRRQAAVALVLLVSLAGGVAMLEVTGTRPRPTSNGSAAAAPQCHDPSGICAAPELCPSLAGRYSAGELEKLRPKVESMVHDQFYSVGMGANSIEVDLFPGRESLAAQLTSRFDDAVEIRMGTTRYCGRPGQSARCADVEGATALPEGLHLTLTLARTSVQATDGFLKGALHVRYDGPGSFILNSGQPVVAKIVKPGTRTVVGTFSGGIAGTGLALNLHDGEQRTVDVILGTSRCDGGTGSALSRGNYGVRAPLGPDGGRALYLAPEVPLTLR